MNMNFMKISYILGIIISIISCDRPTCKNKIALFDKLSPNEKEYKDELVKQLAKVDTSKLTYWLDSYQEIGKTPNIIVAIQGEDLCANIVLTVKQSEKGIEAILKNKGLGYRGAELKNLKFDIQQNEIFTEFVFKEISEILD